jgi:putative sterol carrier protein
MATQQEVAAVFSKMGDRFDARKAEGVNATIQFELSGDNGGSYWLKIADSKLETGDGAIESPRMTLRASADDFYGMMTGTVNPMQAFMMGKIKIAGDTSLALKLMPLING